MDKSFTLFSLPSHNTFSCSFDIASSISKSAIYVYFVSSVTKKTYCKNIRRSSTTRSLILQIFAQDPDTFIDIMLKRELPVMDIFREFSCFEDLAHDTYNLHMLKKVLKKTDLTTEKHLSALSNIFFKVIEVYSLD